MMETIPKGSLLTITTGEYSDYTVHGVFRAVADIDADKLRAEWFLLHPSQDGPYHFEEVAFLAWVAKSGLLESLDCFEWHLSDYSMAEEMDVTVVGDRDWLKWRDAL